MKSLIVWLNRIINKHKALKRWKRVVTVLAAIMTFATTYALILPAITVERSKTEEVGGMYLEQDESREDVFLENAQEPRGVSIAADHEDAVTFAYSDDSMTATAVFGTDEEIPAGAELVVTPVDPESEEYISLCSRSAELLDKEFIYDVTTCSFYDFALVCNNVDVTPKTGLVDIQIIFHNNTVEHVDDTLFAGRFANAVADENGFVEIATGSRTATDKEAAADALISVNPDETSVIELTDGIITALSLKGNDLALSDSLVGILAGNVDEETKAAAAETDAEIPYYGSSREEDTPEYSAEAGGDEAAPEVRTLKATGSDYTVILTYDATSGIPEGAVLSASEISQDSKEYKKYLEKTKKAMGLTEEENLPRYAARFFDIKIMVGDEEFQPESGVSVEITYSEPLAEITDTEVSAVHFADKKAEAEVIEANATEIQDDGAATVEFTAESFSVYGVVYTVDFRWEVNGKTFEFSLSGGDTLSLREMLMTLDVLPKETDSEAEEQSPDSPENQSTPKTLAEDAEEFIRSIKSVTFTNEELLRVAQITEDTTVGELKKSLGVESYYSDELTNEEIDGMNARMLAAPDWALISLLPFSTEEKLTITMSDGEVFEIRVTDASSVGNSLNGRTVTINALGQNPYMVASTAATGGITGLAGKTATNVNGEEDIWVLEYDSTKGGYHIKSHSANAYISIDTSGNFSLVESVDDSETFTIEQDQTGSGTPYYLFSTVYQGVTYFLDLDMSGGRTVFHMDDRATVENGMQFRYHWLQLTDKSPAIAQGGDWMLFTDEKNSTITIHAGETVTLRPFDEWVWKEEQYHEDYWYVKGTDWDWRINPTTNNNWPRPGQRDQDWKETQTINGFEITRYQKWDSQLRTKYWAVQIKATAGSVNQTLTLKNTKHPEREITLVVEPGPPIKYPNTLPGLENIRVNLFDYDFNADLDINPGNTEGEGVVNKSINYNGHALHFLASGNPGDQYGINEYTQDDVNTDIVEKLLVDNYPKLVGGESLRYLFEVTEENTRQWYGGPDPDNPDAIIAYPNVGGLFQQDADGYYYYNSNKNYAIYNIDQDGENPLMTLLAHTYTQNSSNDNADDWNDKPIGFFPFHDYKAKEDLWVQRNSNLNHHLGMSMHLDFEIPKDNNNQVWNPDKERYEDIRYEFSGDDDLWVFIDGELTLDMGGIHQPIRGEINFTDGIITVYNYNGGAGPSTYTKTFDPGAHQLDMFYLERGGCDSNLSVRFNLPLILGTGDVQLIKLSSSDLDKIGTEHEDEIQGLPYAVFGVWEDEECTGQPYAIATSNRNGIVFKNLPVREEGQTFYMREISAPTGYAIDHTLYKVTAGEKDDNDKYPFSVSIVNEDGSTEEPPTFAYHEGGTTIVLPVVPDGTNENINISVKKIWQDAEGNEDEMSTSGIEVPFELRRTQTYITAKAFTVRLWDQNVYNSSAANKREIDAITVHEGDELTISYVHAPDGNYNPWCGTANGSNNVVQFVTNSSGTESRVKYTVNASHANSRSDVIDILIPHGFLEWCNPDRGYSMPIFSDIKNADYSQVTVTGEDDTFNNNNDQSRWITLPRQDLEPGEDPWLGVFSDLPVMYVDPRTGYTYQYSYYIVEDKEHATLPAGYEYEVIYTSSYTDNDNYTPIPGENTQSTNQTGTQTVINRELLDVPVEKYWPDFSGEEYTWTATFRLEELEVDKDTGKPFTENPRWMPVKDGHDEEIQVTVSKDDPTDVFNNLPMYRVREDGTVVRLMYAVGEVSYEVSLHLEGQEPRVIAKWDRINGLQEGDKRYAPQFEQDAGEHGSTIDDYEIKVANRLEDREATREVEIDVSKAWPDGSGIADDPDAYAKFVLRRYVRSEYRDYSRVPTDTQWCDVTLITAEGESQTLKVPAGRTLHIVGHFRPETNGRAVVFTRSDGGTPLQCTSTNKSKTDAEAFEVTLTVPEEEELTLTLDPFGRAENVVGGADGFLLSDTYSGGVTVGEIDPLFIEEFTLDKANDWTYKFEYLPKVEEQKIDPTTGSQTIYVYSYYLEELECEPADYVAEYQYGGHALQIDKDHTVDSSVNLTAANKPIDIKLTLYKVDKSDLTVIPVSKPLGGAVFTVSKYTDKNFRDLDETWKNQGTLQLTGAGTGVFTGEGFVTGYYEIEETRSPMGYVRTAQKQRFKVVLIAKTDPVTGEIKPETKQLKVVKLDGSGNEITTPMESSNMFVVPQSSVMVIGNERGVALPAAGGPGTTVFYATGTLLVLAAAFMLMRRRSQAD